MLGPTFEQAVKIRSPHGRLTPSNDLLRQGHRRVVLPTHQVPPRRLLAPESPEVLGVLDRGGLPSSRPSGAFYVWTDVSEAGVPSLDFARSLIEREHVAVVSGSAFGELGEGYVRLLLASTREDLVDGTSRLAGLVRHLVEARC